MSVPLRVPAIVIALAFALASCSSGASSGPTVTQTGKTVEYSPCAEPTAVAGATVTVGAQSATTAADGSYSIQVPSGAPFTMTVYAPQYIPLIEAQDMVKASYDRGNTLMISTSTASFLESALPGFDSSATFLTVELVKTGNCADVTGTTITVSPTNAGAATEYPAQCVSPVGGTSATDGVFPSASAAVVYNLSPGTHTVSASSPKCKQVPYPYEDPATGLTYEGVVTTEIGDTNAFTRVFLE
jgi:hypothetical protein